jgi:hypothetical protein
MDRSLSSSEDHRRRSQHGNVRNKDPKEFHLLKNLWLWLLPLLYLPNLGLSVPTPFGVLELADFCMAPFLAALLVAPRVHRGYHAARVMRLGVAFVLWAALGCFVMYFFGGSFIGEAENSAIFTFLKIGKLAVYGGAALLVSAKIADNKTREALAWPVLVSAALCGVSLIMVFRSSDGARYDPIQGYKATNLTSVVQAILLSFSFAWYLSGNGSPRWRLSAIPLLALGCLGFGFSHGRGGWLACACALVYLAYSRRRKVNTFAALFALTAVVSAMYALVPSFAAEIDATFHPNPHVMKIYHMGVAGVDDGGRLSTWLHEAPKLVAAPFFGTGLFNRGAETGLWATGSHNFWLQMFLETGAIGGTLVLLLFGLIWRQAGAIPARTAGVALPVRTALVATFVGGLGGEYFYGGPGLFTFLLIYAFVGSLPPKGAELRGR